MAQIKDSKKHFKTRWQWKKYKNLHKNAQEIFLSRLWGFWEGISRYQTAILYKQVLNIMTVNQVIHLVFSTVSCFPKTSLSDFNI